MLFLCPQNITSWLELENIYKWSEIFLSVSFYKYVDGFFFSP